MAVLNIIKKSFVQFYEHLFKLVLLDLIWFFLTAAGLLIGYAGITNSFLLPVIIPLIFTGPLFLSGLEIADRLILREEVGVKDFFTGIGRYFKRGLLGFLFTSGIYLILIIDLIFFVQRGNKNTVMLVIGIIFFYLIIFFSMMQLYFWGLLTVQDKEKIGIIIKRSFLLTLDNALFAFFLLILIVILTVILIITGVGLPVLFMGLTGLLLSNGTRYTLDQYREE